MKTTTEKRARTQVLVLMLTMLCAHSAPAGPPTGQVIREPLISEQHALSTVFNHIDRQQDAIVIENRQHRARFDKNGVHFEPINGPSWHWQGVAESRVKGSRAAPAMTNDNTVDYIRGDITERYLLKAYSIEQRFILQHPPDGGEDLVIEGRIESEGTFEIRDNGWFWFDKLGWSGWGRSRSLTLNAISSRHK